jgi:hypothetical protein
MTWPELTEDIGKAAYVMEMANGMIAKEEAEKQWDKHFARISGKINPYNELDQIKRTVGCALIAMEKLGMVRFS